MLTYQWTFEEEKWNLRDGAGASLFEPQTNEEVRSLTSLYYRRSTSRYLCFAQFSLLYSSSSTIFLIRLNLLAP
jgi:hypothetical protein